VRVPIQIVNGRREELRALIRRDGFVPISQICRRLRISEATARRDLSAVAAGGHISRTWGGALADYNSHFASIDERSLRARTAKGRIAAVAAAMVPLSGTVFLDAGTTIVAVARTLAQRRGLAGLTVVTNSLPVASALGGISGITLHVLGGQLLDRQAALFGPRAVRALREWKFEAAFFGGEAANSAGVYNSHPDVVAFQRLVLRRTDHGYFCLDATKLGAATSHRVAGWGDFSGLISDASARRMAASGIAGRVTQLIRA
jgi:DeoR/GlpR family transcriptional regulator of sugar metabolism